MGLGDDIAQRIQDALKDKKDADTAKAPAGGGTSSKSNTTTTTKASAPQFPTSAQNLLEKEKTLAGIAAKADADFTAKGGYILQGQPNYAVLNGIVYGRSTDGTWGSSYLNKAQQQGVLQQASAEGYKPGATTAGRPIAPLLGSPRTTTGVPAQPPAGQIQLPNGQIGSMPGGTPQPPQSGVVGSVGPLPYGALALSGPRGIGYGPDALPSGLPDNFSYRHVTPQFSNYRAGYTGQLPTALQGLEIARPNDYNASTYFQGNDRGPIGLGNYGGQPADLFPGNGTAEIRNSQGGYPNVGFDTRALLDQYGYKSSGDPMTDSLIASQLLGEQQRRIGENPGLAGSDQLQRELGPQNSPIPYIGGNGIEAGASYATTDGLGRPGEMVQNGGGGWSFTPAAKGADRVMTDPFVILQQGKPPIMGSEYGQNERLRINPMRGGRTLPVGSNPLGVRPQPGMAATGIDLTMHPMPTSDPGAGMQWSPNSQLSGWDSTPQSTQPSAPTPTIPTTTAPIAHTQPITPPAAAPVVTQTANGGSITYPSANSAPAPTTPVTQPGSTQTSNSGSTTYPPASTPSAPSADATMAQNDAFQFAQQQRQRDTEAYKYQLAGLPPQTGVYTNTPMNQPAGFYSQMPNYGQQVQQAQQQLNILGPTTDLNTLYSQYGAAQNAYYNAPDDASRAAALAQRETIYNQIQRSSQALGLQNTVASGAGQTMSPGLDSPVNPTLQGSVQGVQQFSPELGNYMAKLQAANQPVIPQDATYMQALVNQISNVQQRQQANNALAILIGQLGGVKPPALGSTVQSDPLAILAATKFAA